jgi:Zn-dependent metalloprotease
MPHAPHPPGHRCAHDPVCLILPPDALARVIAEGADDQQEAALQTIVSSASLRMQRTVVAALLRTLEGDARSALLAAPSDARQSVYDVEHGGSNDLPGRLVRGQHDPPAADPAVNEAFDGTADTWTFYRDVFDRDSVDGRGGELVSSVHYGVDFDNAMWNGVQMVYGDGSGTLFARGALTRALDIIGHELTHGVTQHTANLVYSKQSGALNEHFSDVFGTLVKQYTLRQSAEQADWLIGAGALAPGLGSALRSMKAPGTAWRFDDQPATMDGYRDLPDDNRPSNDNGGVHINSGIPNHAFYLAATKLGGNAWEAPGRIWFTTLTERLRADARFADAARATIDVARDLFGAGSEEERAVTHAWTEVGVLGAPVL